MASKIKITPSNVYLIEIIKPIAFLSFDRYIQEATKGPDNRFYIDKGSPGRKSIGDKSVKILAQNINYLKND